MQSLIEGGDQYANIRVSKQMSKKQVAVLKKPTPFKHIDSEFDKILREVYV